MHSKWQIWDFFSSWKRDFLADYHGLLTLGAFDPVCLKLMKEYLLSGCRERTVHHKTASDVTRDWIDDEFQALSLFGNSDCFFIHQAQDLAADLVERFSSLDLADRFVILSFDTEAAAGRKLAKLQGIDRLTVEAPRFWEIHKLLDFTCSYLRLPLSFEAKTWVLGAIENNLATFYNSCYLLKLNYPETKEISVTQVKEILTLERLDQFELASLLGRKKLQQFFGTLVELEGDFEKMRYFFFFLQSHIVKMLDPSFLADKPRLSQYDKDIQNSSKLWDEKELQKLLESVCHWEILSKKKDHLLWHELRTAHLRSLAESRTV